jgi:hypothetical protein
MRSYFTPARVTHALMALGAGVAVFCYELTDVVSNAYAEAGLWAGLATLGALGIGTVKRSSP